MSKGAAVHIARIPNIRLPHALSPRRKARLSAMAAPIRRVGSNGAANIVFGYKLPSTFIAAVLGSP